MAKMVEIDEEDFLRSQKLRDTVAKIMAHPKGKLLVQEAHKMVDPAAATPDLDAQKPIQDQFAALSTQLAEERAARVAEKNERENREKVMELTGKVERGIAQLKADGWTDDGIKGVREIMDAQGILDPAIAAAYFEKLHPPQTPIMPQPMTGFDYLNQPAEGGDEFLQKLISSRGDSEGALHKRIGETLGEIRNGPRR